MMMSIILILLIWTSAPCLGQLSAAQSAGVKNIESTKILIIYLSRTKNTKAVAEMIQDHVGGTLIELELVRPYPEDYRAIVAQVAKENETGFLPPLKTKVPNLDDYEAIFLGFPTWGMQLPPPMKSFLRENDLRGTTVIPFNTNGGYGIGSSFETVEKLCKGCRILEGFSVRGGLERDGILFVMEGERQLEVCEEVKKWLERIGFTQQATR
jgi:flavodoxin